MKFREWLKLEMPITNFQLVGQWDKTPKGTMSPLKLGRDKYDSRIPSPYDKKDFGILTNPAAVQKIHLQWSKTTQKFDFMFIRSKEAAQHVEVGEVTPEWVKEHLKVDIQPEEDKIKVIFTNNVGAEKIPMTAWMIAHRLGHAIKRQYAWNEFTQAVDREFQDILQNVYGFRGPGLERSGGNFGGGRYKSPQGETDHRDIRVKFSDEPKFLALANAVGTMRSATQGITRYGEFHFELLAQYIRSGKVAFKKPLPRKINAPGLGRDGLWARVSQDVIEEYSEQLDTLEQTCDYYLEQALNELEGKIFVM